MPTPRVLAAAAARASPPKRRARRSGCARRGRGTPAAQPDEPGRVTLFALRRLTAGLFVYVVYEHPSLRALEAPHSSRATIAAQVRASGCMSAKPRCPGAAHRVRAPCARTSAQIFRASVSARACARAECENVIGRCAPHMQASARRRRSPARRAGERLFDHVEIGWMCAVRTSLGPCVLCAVVPRNAARSVRV
jgi:hypothetical protein